MGGDLTPLRRDKLPKLHTRRRVPATAMSLSENCLRFLLLHPGWPVDLQLAGRLESEIELKQEQEANS